MFLFEFSSKNPSGKNPHFFQFLNLLVDFFFTENLQGFFGGRGLIVYFGSLANKRVVEIQFTLRQLPDERTFFDKEHVFLNCALHRV